MTSFYSITFLTSFIEVHPYSHFPIQNLPYSVFKPQPGSLARPGVDIGDYVLDLSEIAAAGLFNSPTLILFQIRYHQPCSHESFLPLYSSHLLCLQTFFRI
ncbi:hypothetical protein TB2_027054 [Malus domestica]